MGLSKAQDPFLYAGHIILTFLTKANIAQLKSVSIVFKLSAFRKELTVYVCTQLDNKLQIISAKYIFIGLFIIRIEMKPLISSSRLSAWHSGLDESVEHKWRKD